MSHPYQDPSLPPEARTQDLLARMNSEEKIGQMMQLDGQEDLTKLVRDTKIGSILHLNGSRADEAIDLASRTRLGIPLLIGDDCIHGHSFWPGATIFPTQLGMAASWNESLIEEAARITAREVSGTGVHWTFSPVLCLTRDLRWGRVGETFGEDPTLIERFGTAMIRGYQGKGLDDSEAILATAKHYAGYSETQGGRDASEADLSRRKLRSYFLPPFEAAARAGCMAFMTGYQSIEGVPSTANSWLLKTVLREEWGFEGLLVTDWDNVGRMVYEQKVCADYADAATRAVRSGNDLMMATEKFREGALSALEAGTLDEEELNEAVHRILLLKFRMGLFENPKGTNPEVHSIVGCEAHRKVNLELARESVILLRNRKDLLPLDPEASLNIALIGPNADNEHMHLGDWAGISGQMEVEASRHPRECTVTLKDALESFAPDTWQVKSRRGCNILDEDDSLLPPALEAARQADVVVAAVGDDFPLIGEYKSTGTLELQGGQIRLLEELFSLGKPVILVLLHSKPNVLPACTEKADAVLEAFNPGMMGGQALTDIIAGVVNPSGKLTVSVPYHVGQQPVYYSQVRGQHGDTYADITQSPQFAFGEGLSYTTFALSTLTLDRDQAGPGDVIHCSVTATNTGARAGKVTVQLYIHDPVTSVTWVQKELKEFRKIDLLPGEATELDFTLPVNACSVVNSEGTRVVEPGEIVVEAALSSRDEHSLTRSFTITS